MPSKAILSEKQAIVDALAQRLQEAQSGVLVDYRGINVAQDTELRRDLRGSNVEYSVIKNTLTRFAMDKVGLSGLDDQLNGTTSLATSTEDTAGNFMWGDALGIRKMSAPGATVTAVKKYVELFFREPGRFLQLKWDFIKKTMGISQPLDYSEYDYNRWERMGEYGFNDSLQRKAFYDSFIRSTMPPGAGTSGPAARGFRIRKSRAASTATAAQYADICPEYAALIRSANSMSPSPRLFAFVLKSYTVALRAAPLPRNTTRSNCPDSHFPLDSSS